VVALVELNEAVTSNQRPKSLKQWSWSLVCRYVFVFHLLLEPIWMHMVKSQTHNYRCSMIVKAYTKKQSNIYLHPTTPTLCTGTQVFDYTRQSTKWTWQTCQFDKKQPLHIQHMNLLAGPRGPAKTRFRMESFICLFVYFWPRCTCVGCSARQSALLLFYHVEALCRHLFQIS
jgi:hypothetical protein